MAYHLTEQLRGNFFVSSLLTFAHTAKIILVMGYILQHEGLKRREFNNE